MIRFLPLLLVACAPPPQCVTTCGVAIIGESVSCEDYQRVESEIVAKVSPILPNACETLRGTTATALPGRSSIHQGRMVEGWTNCVAGEVYFHVDYPRFWRTAFGHELIHVAQRCDAPAPVDKHRDIDHANWTRSGLARAMLDALEVLEVEDAWRQAFGEGFCDTHTQC